MKLQITGKNVPLTPQVRQYIERKFGKLNRHLPNITVSEVEISQEKTRSPQQHFVVQAKIDSKGTLLYSEARGEDLFSSIDRTAAAIDRQIEQHKGKLHDKGRGNSLARSEFKEGTDTTPPPASVVKVKRFAIKPMSLDEAIDQMELLGHNFFLFLNADSEGVNLLYRRKDGNYGLIEPDLG